jgi:hypothetical protein
VTEPRFEVIDGSALPLIWRELLHPGEPLVGHPGSPPLPRYFYRIPSWEAARQFKLTAHFTLSELMSVDCREAPRLLHEFPHYVPCTVSILARYLEEFRVRVEAPVFIAVNGGYRSPSHAFSQRLSPHLWAAAANIYRIGDTFLDTERAIEKYSRVAESIGQEVHVKPFGPAEHQTDDHLHLDLGLLHWEPAHP